MNTGRWIAAQTDIYGEYIPGTQRDITEHVLDAARAEFAEDVTAQECAAQDYTQELIDESRVSHTYWFATAYGLQQG